MNNILNVPNIDELSGTVPYEGAVIRKNADFEQMLKQVLYKEIFLSFTTKTKYYIFFFQSMLFFPFLPFRIEYSSKAFIKHKILSK